MLDVFVLAAAGEEVGGTLASVGARAVRTDDEIRDALASGGEKVLWIARNADAAAALVRAALKDPSPRTAMTQGLLVQERISAAQRALYGQRFRPVLSPARSVRVLPLDEISEVLTAEDPGDYFIGMAVDCASRMVLLQRGSLELVVVEFEWFQRPDTPVQPDFSDAALEEYGQVVRLGEYTAATSAILYDFDPGYRKKARERALALDTSIGGCIRRLRIQRGLRQSDFPGLSTKEIGRIERGDVESPHRGTLQAIAARLGVSVEELASY
jgi:hypothetical protein